MNDFIPYGRQWVTEEDVQAVSDVLLSDWLTTGPSVVAFEDALSRQCGAKFSVAVNSGTAALHAAYAAIGLGPGDEVIVPSLTFSATANAALYLGATPVFADVDEHTYTMSPASAAALVTERTRAICAVDFAGHPADYDALRELCDRHSLVLIGDAAHSIGATYKGRPIGSVCDLTCFSFHPVKTVTTGEGGAILTDNPQYDDALRAFRSHGIVRDVSEVDGNEVGGWGYDIATLGYNYRITDFQCALGSSQLRHLTEWVEARQAIAGRYRDAFADIAVGLPPASPDCSHAYHLFVIRVAAARRREIFETLRSTGVGVQVHYIPVNMLTMYRSRGYSPDETPVAKSLYQEFISLPCYPRLTTVEQERVIEAVRAAL